MVMQTERYVERKGRLRPVEKRSRERKRSLKGEKQERFFYTQVSRKTGMCYRGHSHSVIVIINDHTSSERILKHQLEIFLKLMFGAKLV